MISLWYVFFFMMADVMPNYHGGDGGGQDPPPGGFGLGGHEADVVPPRRKRGNAKNTKLLKATADGKRLSLEFDKEATFETVGETCSLFKRAIGSYMWGNFAFDKESYTYVDEHERNAMNEHLRRKFDYDAIQRDPKRAHIIDGLRSIYIKQYRSRKSEATKKFKAMGGYEALPGIRDTPPVGMGPDNWGKTIDYFCTDKFRNRSLVNKQNRSKQIYANRGGSCSYANWAHKQKKDRLETFRDAHTLPDGTFPSEREENAYERVRQEIESRRNASQTVTQGESSTPPPVNQPECFEKALGRRRGHIKGIGRKPNICSGLHFEEFSQPRDVSTPPPPYTQAELDRMFGDPGFLARMKSLFPSLNNSEQGSRDDDETDGGDD